MLQHKSSDVIINQLQINLNSKIQLYGWELTKLIDIKRQEYALRFIPIETKMAQVKVNMSKAPNETVQFVHAFLQHSKAAEEVLRDSTRVVLIMVLAYTS